MKYFLKPSITGKKEKSASRQPTTALFSPLIRVLPFTGKDTVMVTIFTLCVKLNNSKTKLQEMTDEANNKFRNSSADHCTHCNRTRLKIRQNSYTRQITEWINGRIEDNQIVSKQYECECGKTHVLLPALVIPYCLYSLPFIIRVLYEYFTHKDTVSNICEKYGISITTLYRWKKKFLKDKAVWLERLKDAETTAEKFLDFLKTMEDPGRQLREYACGVHMHIQFLQTHKYAYSHRHL